MIPRGKPYELLIFSVWRVIVWKEFETNGQLNKLSLNASMHRWIKPRALDTVFMCCIYFMFYHVMN